MSAHVVELLWHLFCLSGSQCSFLLLLLLPLLLLLHLLFAASTVGSSSNQDGWLVGWIDGWRKRTVNRTVARLWPAGAREGRFPGPLTSG